MIFDIRAHGTTHALLISVDPDTARLHLTTQRLPNPASPPPFCQFLRAHVQGARIDALEQIHDDRLVALRVSTREGPRTLVAALTGRTADLLALDAEGKILTALQTGQERAGRTYEPPSRHEPAVERTATSREGGKTPRGGDPFPASREIEQRYADREQESARRRSRETKLAELRKQIKKTGRRIETLQADLQKASLYRDYARYGELLKANLHALKKGQDQITVPDYFDPSLPELTIPVDPAKSPRGNMDDYFKKHRKYLAAEREIRPRVRQMEEELLRLQAARAAIERGEWEPDAPAPAPSSPARAATKRPVERRGPYRRFTSADGLPIFVGRNAAENEELTFKLAKSDDLWLHAQGMPGSHVVIRLERGAEPPPETLRDAATLAILYSDLKKSGKGEVLYTRRKHVRKIKGKPAGTVTVTQERTLFIQLDRTRLDRLRTSAH